MSDGIAFHTPNDYGSDDVVCRTLSLPFSLWPYVNGVIDFLSDAANWQQVGTVTPEEIAQEFANRLDNLYDSECSMQIGMIFPMVHINPPDNLIWCRGSVHLKSNYPDLYAILPAWLILDETRFRVPNLMGRFVTGTNQAILEGDTSNGATFLTVDNLPAHQHTHNRLGVTTAVVARPGEPGNPAIGIGEELTGVIGEGSPFFPRPPYLALNWYIVAK